MLCERAALAQIARAWQFRDHDLGAQCERCFQPTFKVERGDSRRAVCPLCKVERSGRKWRRERPSVAHMRRARRGDVA